MNSLNVIRNLKKALESVDDFTAAYLELTRDFFFDRIPVDLQRKLVETAVSVGREIVGKIVEETGTTNSWCIAEYLGLEISMVSQENVVGNLLIRSEYIPPKTIRIYKRSIEQLKEAISRFGLEELFPNEAILDLHVAHEIFHHLEKTRIGVLSERYSIERFRFGPLCFKIRVRAISEIAAHTFARTLTSVKVPPSILDYIATGNIDNLLAKLAEIKKGVVLL
ncbi:MAG: hypothetical protein QXO34_01705 [Candidatus Bathyarchaeia archaeon]